MNRIRRRALESAGPLAINATAIQRHGKNASNGCFANAAMAAEDITMRNPLLIDGILQGAGHVFLPNHLRKTLWPVLAR